MITYFTSKRYKDHYYCFVNNDVILINLLHESVYIIKDPYTLNQIHKHKDKEIVNDSFIYKLRYLINNYLLKETDNYTKLISKYTHLHKVINNGNVH